MISILLPTRKRPHNLRHLVESLYDTVERPLGKFHDKIKIRCYVDDDDDSYPQKDFPEVDFMRGPRMTMSDMWNALIPRPKFSVDGDLLMMCGDDVIFKTWGWNRMVENEFNSCPDKILLVHGDDGSERGKEFATLPIVHQRWVEILGHFAGAGYSCDFADSHPNDIADMIGRRRYLPYETPHLHPAWGKAEMDDTYRETRERGERDNTAKLYQNRLQERMIYAESLRKELGTHWLPTMK